MSIYRLAIGVSRTSLKVRGFRSKALLALWEEETAPSAVRCGSDRMLRRLIEGIHVKGISILLSLLMFFIGWGLMLIAPLTLRDFCLKAGIFNPFSEKEKNPRPNFAFLTRFYSKTHYTMMWMLRALWLVVAHDLLRYRYMDDVRGNLFPLICSTSRAVLKMFVRLFRIKASESLVKSLSRAIYKEEKWRTRDKKNSWLLENASKKKSSQQLTSCVIATRD